MYLFGKELQVVNNIIFFITNNISDEQERQKELFLIKQIQNLFYIEPFFPKTTLFTILYTELLVHNLSSNYYSLCAQLCTVYQKCTQPHIKITEKLT